MQNALQNRQHLAVTLVLIFAPQVFRKALCIEVFSIHFFPQILWYNRIFFEKHKKLNTNRAPQVHFCWLPRRIWVTSMPKKICFRILFAFIVFSVETTWNFGTFYYLFGIFENSSSTASDLSKLHEWDLIDVSCSPGIIETWEIFFGSLEFCLKWMIFWDCFAFT